MCAKFQNTFQEGIDKDTSKNKYSNKRYPGAQNLRIVGGSLYADGTLESVEGNNSIIETPDDLGGGARHYIIGYTQVRDKLIIFTTSTDSPNTGSTDTIVCIDIDDIDAATTTITLDFTDYYWNSGGGNSYHKIYQTSTAFDAKGNLLFSRDHPIRAVAHYDSDSVQKVYWVDNYNYLRHINLIYDADTNDLTALDVDKLDIIGNLDVTQPTVDEIISGSLVSGMYQYAYQLYNENGAETNFSPASYLIPVAGSSLSLSKSLHFKGTGLGENTGAGVRGSITVDSEDYNKIRVIAIQYETFAGEPSIRVIEEIAAPESGESVMFTDTGQALGTFTVEEYRIGKQLFSALDLQHKDNRLFPINITEDFFDVDYDARAYRYDGNRVSRLYDSSYNQDLADDPYLERDIPAGADPDKWYSNNGANGGNDVATDADMPETYDCFNAFNDYDNDDTVAAGSKAPYKYQSDGSTLGGSGTNVSYKFNEDGAGYTEYIIDTVDQFPLVIDVSGSTSQEFYTIPVGSDSYTNFASPYKVRDYVGYRRDEVYRFGIVFYDDRGRTSPVKWIGDIRMPHPTAEVHPFDADTDVLGTRQIRAYPLGIEFTVDNIPDEAQGFRIVRVRRTGNDRNILSQGMISATELDATSTYHLFANAAMGGNSIHFPSATTPLVQNIDLRLFNSPEVSFYKDLQYVTGDWLEVVYYIDHASSVGKHRTGAGAIAANTSAVGGDLSWAWNKVDKNNAALVYPILGGAGSYSARWKDYFTDGRVIGPSEAQQSVGGQIYQPFRYAYKGTCFVYEHNNGNFTVTGGVDRDEPVICNYKRNRYTSAYGGFTHAARQLNEYIECGPYTEDPGGAATLTVFGGDTILGIFEQQLLVARDTESAGAAGYTYSETCQIPLETTINLPYRHDDFWARVYALQYSPVIQETAGVHDINAGTTQNYTYTQYTDLYEVNTVYSQQETGRIHFPKSEYWEEEEEFDVRTLYSDEKVLGELFDSWIEFRTNNYKDATSNHGELEAIVKFRDVLYFFQPKAFGRLSINPRELHQSDEGVAEFVLGTGSILDRYVYMSDETGATSYYAVQVTPKGIYWVDSINKKIMFTDGQQIINLSLSKSIQTWFSKYFDESGQVAIGYDAEHKEVLFSFDVNYQGLVVEDSSASGNYYDTHVMTDTIGFFDDMTFDDSDINSLESLEPWELTFETVSSYTEGDIITFSTRFTIVYSEITERFTAFYTIQPTQYIMFRDTLMSTINDYELFRHNDGDQCYFFDNYTASRLQGLINPNGHLANTFNNIEMMFDAVDEDDWNNAEVSPNQVRFLNDYQLTETVDLTASTADIRRRFRKWRMVIPRARYDEQLGDLDRYDARMRDSYVLVELWYDHDSDNYKVRYHDLVTSHLPSNM